MEPLSQSFSVVSPPVVVGVDGSSDSLHALMWAAAAAIERRTPLRIVHAWVVPAVAFTTPVVPPMFIDPTVFEASAATVVSEAVEMLRARLGIDCPQLEPITIAGEPTGVLLKESRSACLLVVGSHGRGVVSRTVLGSVAERCLTRAGVPVAVIRQEVVPSVGGPVVVGVEDTAAAREALRWAAIEAGRLGRRLEVVHAHDVGTALRPDLGELPPALEQPIDRSVRRFLDHLLTEIALIGERPRSVAWRVVAGQADEVLVQASASASLLVVGSPHPHGLVERVVGSTGRVCVREATCPVVVVPSAVADEQARELECAS